MSSCFTVCLRGAGVPLYLARALAKITDLSGTEYERTAVEITINFIRALLITPIQSWSLLHQWRYTGKAADATGQYADKTEEAADGTTRKTQDGSMAKAHKREDETPSNVLLLGKPQEDSMAKVETPSKPQESGARLDDIDSKFTV